MKLEVDVVSPDEILVSHIPETDEDQEQLRLLGENVFRLDPGSAMKVTCGSISRGGLLQEFKLRIFS